MGKQGKADTGWTKSPILTRQQSPPPIVIDCSDWGRLLEIAVVPNRILDGRAQVRFATKLLAAVDEADRSQQGSGFRRIGLKAKGREIIIALAPIEPEGANARIRKICMTLSEPNAAWRREAGIEKLTARLA